MIRRVLISSAVLVFAAIPALADDKLDVKKLKGKWEREVGGNKIVFEFKDDKTMRCLMTPQGLNESAEVDCDYKLGDDGVVSLTIVKIDKKGADGLPDKDDSFTFKVALEKDVLTISDLKGSKASDDAKQFVEGDYKKVK